MDFATHLFFESPLWLGAFSFLFFAGILFARLRWEPGAARRYAVPATLLLIALLFVVQKLVVTRHEEILQALETFVRAMEREDLPAIKDGLAEEYAREGMNRDEFAAYLASFLKVVDIRDTRFGRRDLDIGVDTAEMNLSARATVSIRGDVGQFHWGAWRIGWLRQLDGWKIASIRPVMIDGRPIKTLRALRGHVSGPSGGS